MTLREKLREIISEHPDNRSAYAPTDKEIDAILTLVRQTIEEARKQLENEYEMKHKAYCYAPMIKREKDFPKPKQPDISDYHTALLEKLK